MSEKETYTILTPVKHGVETAEGTKALELARGTFHDFTAEEAESLVACKAIRKGKFQLADTEIVEEETVRTDPAPSVVTDAAGKGDKDVNEVTPEGDLASDQGQTPGVAPGEADQL